MERANNNTSIFMYYKNNNTVMKQPWESSSYEGDDHDHDQDQDDNNDFFYVDHDGMMMMTWPPRSYTCSFCKREFRSAQALGGHMNVHRRDRAQLRQLSQISSSPNSSPNNHINNNSITNHTLNLNLPPNNSNNNTIVISPQTPSPNKPAVNFFSKKLTPPSSPKVVANHTDLITRKQFECFKRKNNLVDKQREGYFGNFKKSVPGLIRLDLEMNIDVGREDLDLELRLGYN